MIQIAIIEDNRLVREGLTRKLNEQPGFEVTYSAARGSIDALREAAPRVLLLDAGLEVVDSLELAERVRDGLPETPVIVMDLLPIHEELVEFVTVGVAGFVLKDATLEELLATIRSVAGGRTILPPEMASTLFSQIVQEAVLRDSDELGEATDLTPRERNVVGLIGEGMSNKAIAKSLGISPNTVKSHVRNVMEKLALHSRLQIAAYLHKGPDESVE
ncbi:MAG: DNA-binding response regulator [Gemmatimonadales bacterium]|nr:MAG: DNA-binding response regulator [Gemmatimonadales bacterium]